jgi:spore coat protein JB
MNRNQAMRKLQAARFALWEMHLYLDTHPEDLTTLAAYKKQQARYSLLADEYEEKYGALGQMDAAGVEWFKNPWPWDSVVCD